MSVFDERRAGVLLPLPAVPGSPLIGDFGAGARRFVTELAEAGFSWWQVLPMGPTSAERGDSPYSALSAFALDPIFADLEALVSQDLLAPTPASTGRVDYAAARALKRPLVRKAAELSLERDRPGVEAFVDSQPWVRGWALYSVLCADLGTHWQTWPAPLRDRDTEALAAVEREHAQAIAVEIATQRLLADQWQSLREHAASLGVRIFGDLPIYLVAESADAWQHPALFGLDTHGRPRYESGVPPDAFSESGQTWESPVYDWEVSAASDHAWWRERLACERARLDLLRLDHFRGFSAYWRIPAGWAASEGEWAPGPGAAFFDRVFQDLDPAFFVAEDLGTIDAPVRDLLAHTGLAGMRVLQFGFGKADSAEGVGSHRVGALPARCVAYSGTHDNDTLVGWWASLDAAARARVMEATLAARADLPAALIDELFESRASLVIVPLADLLGLRSEARINTPGRKLDNWGWRAPAGALQGELGSLNRARLGRTGRLRGAREGS